MYLILKQTRHVSPIDGNPQPDLYHAVRLSPASLLTLTAIEQLGETFKGFTITTTRPAPEAKDMVWTWDMLHKRWRSEGIK